MFRRTEQIRFWEKKTLENHFGCPTSSSLTKSENSSGKTLESSQTFLSGSLVSSEQVKRIFWLRFLPTAPWSPQEGSTAHFTAPWTSGISHSTCKSVPLSSRTGCTKRPMFDSTGRWYRRCCYRLSSTSTNTGFWIIIRTSPWWTRTWKISVTAHSSATTVP